MNERTSAIQAGQQLSLFDLRGRRVLVLGLGESGLAAVRYANSREALLQVIDTREQPPALARLNELYPQVSFTTKALDAIDCDDFDLIIWSPGISIERGAGAALYQAAAQAGVPVVGELDIFMQALNLTMAEACEAAVLEFEHQQAERTAQAEAVADEKAREYARTVAIEAAAGQIELPGSESEGADTNAGEAVIDDELEAEAAFKAEIEAEAEAESETESDTDTANPVALAAAAANLQVHAPRSAGKRSTDETAPLPPDLGPRARVLAVTGTNGKTTVCSLAREMALATGANVRAVGNIGPTMLDAICDAREAGELPTIWILELSSFQLALSRQFDPDVALVLNLTPDHLDWHESMASYAAAKRRIAGSQTHLILPAGKLAEGLASMARRGVPVTGMTKAAARAAANAAPQTSFGLTDPVNSGDTGIVHSGGIAWLAEAQAGELPGTVRRRSEPEPPVIKRLMPVDVLQIQGEHNQLNALAALALCRAAGLPMASMLHALRQYRGERHRCEVVARVNDITWVNDSKGTNVGATCAALNGQTDPVWLIAGGLGKDQDFTPLAQAVRDHALGVVLIGQAADQLRAVLENTGVALHEAADLPAAVVIAGELAEPGHIVLLSPACASFDMFNNYQERGDVFTRSVQSWAEDKGQMMELPC